MLTATSVRANSVTLSWTAPPTGCCPVAGYRVTYVRAFNDVISSQQFGNVTTGTINAQPTQQYTYWISAQDSLGNHLASSNSVTVVTPASDTGADTVPPQAPTNLTATTAADGQVNLTWSPSTDNVGVVGYDVYHFDGLYISTLVATVTGTTAPAYGRSARNIYYVRARDAAGNVSIASNTVTAGMWTPGPSTSPSVRPPACRAAYTVTSRWRGGFVANVAVTNTGSAPVSGWTLAFAFGGDQQISNLWNGNHTQSGAQVTVTNAHWNAAIPVGRTVSVGFVGRYADSDAPPAAFTLNGGTCTAG